MTFLRTLRSRITSPAQEGSGALAPRRRPPPRPPTTPLARAAVTFVALAAALPCQFRRTAHPQETIEAGNGTLLPFGCLESTAFTEGRTQILLRNQELPGPGAVLVGIEVHCQSTVAVDYASLAIDACPTTASSLSLTFADNLNASVQPLLRATNLRIVYDGFNWSPILLQFPYVHDGVSDLVIEVRKVVNPATAPFATMSATSNPPRLDLPAMVASFGGPGSGAATAASAQTLTAPLSMRLIWSGVPTVRLLGDSAASGNQFGLGGSIGHTVAGTPGSIVADFVGTSFLDPPVTLGPIRGRLLVQGVTLDFAALPAGGEAGFRMAIPNDPSLVGLHLTFQSATIDHVTGIAQFTNGGDLFVNP